MLLSAATPSLGACASHTTPPDGGVDATADLDAGNDAPTVADAGTDAFDAGPCAPGAPYFGDAAGAPDGGDAGDGSASASCYFYVDLPCGATYPESQCHLLLADCQNVCKRSSFNCHYTASSCDDDAGIVTPPPARATVACDVCGLVGRRPAGLARAMPRRAKTAMGDYFARVAHFEAASVDAFEALHDELVALDAPDALAAMAIRSAHDEVRHAEVSGRIARRHGGEPPRCRVRARRARSEEAIARENVVEGCVRETFGAMLATWQAAHAKDPEVKAAMRGIARDETRHAALAWAIDRWLDGRMSPRARARIARARRAAIAKLRREIDVPIDAVLVQKAGLPDRTSALLLFESVLEQVWS